jgi:hypothetical protein
MGALCQGAVERLRRRLLYPDGNNASSGENLAGASGIRHMIGTLCREADGDRTFVTGFWSGSGKEPRQGRFGISGREKLCPKVRINNNQNDSGPRAH